MQIRSNSNNYRSPFEVPQNKGGQPSSKAQVNSSQKGSWLSYFKNSSLFKTSWFGYQNQKEGLSAQSNVKVIEMKPLSKKNVADAITILNEAQKKVANIDTFSRKKLAENPIHKEVDEAKELLISAVPSRIKEEEKQSFKEELIKDLESNEGGHQKNYDAFIIASQIVKIFEPDEKSKQEARYTLRKMKETYPGDRITVLMSLAKFLQKR